MKDKIKIAWISNAPHNHTGGICTYTRLFYENLSDTYEIHEFHARTPKKHWIKIADPLHDRIIDISGGSSAYKITPLKKMNALLKGSEFDIVINNTLDIANNNSLKSKKLIMVQHMNHSHYLTKNLPWDQKVKKRLDSFFLRYRTTKNILDCSKSSVFFSEFNNIKKVNNLPAYIPIPSPSDISTRKIFKREHFTFIGRMTATSIKHKGIEELSNLIKSTNLKIKLYGNSAESIIEKYSLKENWEGPLKRKDFSKAFEGSTALILTSHFEGFPIVMTEALKAGVPVIAFDTFDSMEFFQQSGAVFPINNMDITLMEDKMQWLNNMTKNEYDEICNKAISFYKKHLTNKQFKENWIKHITSVLKNIDA